MSASALRPHSFNKFPVVLITVMATHAFLLLFRSLEMPDKNSENSNQSTPLKIRSLRIVGTKKSDFKNFSLTNAPEATRNTKNAKKLSFSDLSVTPTQTTPHPHQNVQPVRPGTRPGVIPQRKKALSGISLKGKEIERFAQESKSMAFSEAQVPGLSTSDVSVNLEVPEGVSPDELNEYELMFYGFQKRTFINYVNAFYKNLNRFQRENPHLQFPMTDTKQVMTGRLTYDEKGNIRRIKMVRWTNDQRLQDFFEKVMKDMDTLHNPPRALWEKSGEFSIFFTLVLNG